MAAHHTSVLRTDACVSYARAVLIDPPLRLAYRVAHRLLRTYWLVRRPHTSGALAAIWFDGRVLLVRSSYRRSCSLPGGYVKPGEDPRDAASRELHEEVGIRIAPASLEHAHHGTKAFEARRDTLDIFEATLDAPPVIRIDHREIVWAELVTPAHARTLDLVPHVAEYLEGR